MNLPSSAANYPLSPSPDLHVPGRQPPVVIDWHYWQKRRSLMARVNTDLPQYLVLPEIHVVLDKALNPQLHFLLNLTWHTGARVSEALALSREDLILETVRDSLVILANSKRKAGRPSKKNKAAHSPKRLVPLADPGFIDEAKRYLAGINPRKDEPIFTWTRHQVRYQLGKLEQEHFWDAEEDRSILPVESLSPHTFRHSFAVNCLLQGRDIRTIQDWMGHADLASTEVYLKVLSGETHHLMYGMQF